MAFIRTSLIPVRLAIHTVCLFLVVPVPIKHLNWHFVSTIIWHDYNSLSFNFSKSAYLHKIQFHYVSSLKTLFTTCYHFAPTFLRTTAHFLSLPTYRISYALVLLLILLHPYWLPLPSSTSINRQSNVRSPSSKDPLSMTSTSRTSVSMLLGFTMMWKKITHSDSYRSVRISLHRAKQDSVYSLISTLRRTLRLWSIQASVSPNVMRIGVPHTTELIAY